MKSHIDGSPPSGKIMPLEEVLVEPLPKKEGYSNDESTSDEDILSILNVVVDYVMVRPTPLEPDEFSWELQRKMPRSKADILDQESDYDEEVQVPVLRIFGPISRPLSHVASQSQSSLVHDDNNANIDNKATSENFEAILNRQSGCLYIHGAYPYLLARPVVAGIDGSPFTYDKESKGGEDNIIFTDWDDPESVDAITTELHIQLEGALKAYFDAELLRTLGQRNQDSSRTTGQQSTSFGESSHSKAPIRYIRSISIVMGRGFYSFSLGPAAPFLRIEYYNPKMRWIVKALLEQGLDVPASLHPDPYQYEQGSDVDATVGRLKFHCFEAHIPYTMQVFKDLNLSGMSPVHVRDCRFRTPLPRKRRARVVSHRDDEVLNNQSISSLSHLFLKGNISDNLLWQSVCNMENSSSSCVEMDEFWTRRETSCDIEADTTVHNISNVTQILRPDDDNAKDHTIHWRAVPSLREIWEEEKRRMEYLCSRTKDSNEVYNFDAPPTSKSGTKLAIAGAQRLFESTPEIYGYFLRALTDITNFHAKEVGEEDQRFQSIRTKVNQDIENSKDLDQDTDILDMLRALAAQHSPVIESSKNYSHSKIDQVLMRSLTTPDALTPRISSSKKQEKASMDFHKLSADIEFGKSVDRCNLVEEFSSNDPKDVILNPLTLTMERNDDDDEDSFVNEEEFERSLSESTEKSLHMADLDVSEVLMNNDHDCRQFDRPPKSVEETYVERHSNKESSPSIYNKQYEYSPQTRIARTSNKPLLRGSFYEICVKAPNRSEVMNSLFRFQESSSKHYRNLFSNPILDEMEWASSLTGRNYETLSYYAPTMGPPSTISVLQWQSQDPLYQKNKNRQHNQSGYRSSNSTSHTSVKNFQDRHEELYSNTDEATQFAKGTASLSSTQDDTSGKTRRNCRTNSHIPMKKSAHSSVVGPNDVASSASYGTSFDMKATSSSKALTSGGLSLMSIEIHVQCRIGKSSLNKTKDIALFPDPAQDPIFAIAYLYSLDPGNGERIQILEQGCIFIPISKKVGSSLEHDELGDIEALGVSSKLNIEAVADERHLLLRFSSIVQLKDPDILISWDTQSAGIGYIISRGEELRKLDLANKQYQLDMIRLLGRTPRSRQSSDCVMNGSAVEEGDDNKITGSGLGTDWDDLVGAGVLASSIVRLLNTHFCYMIFIFDA